MYKCSSFKAFCNSSDVFVMKMSLRKLKVMHIFYSLQFAISKNLPNETFYLIENRFIFRQYIEINFRQLLYVYRNRKKVSLKCVDNMINGCMLNEAFRIKP